MTAGDAEVADVVADFDLAVAGAVQDASGDTVGADVLSPRLGEGVVGEVSDDVPGGGARGDAQRPAGRADPLAELGPDGLLGGGSGSGFQGVGDSLVSQRGARALALLDVVVGADADSRESGCHVDDRNVVADLEGLLQAPGLFVPGCCLQVLRSIPGHVPAGPGMAGEVPFHVAGARVQGPGQCVLRPGVLGEFLADLAQLVLDLGCPGFGFLRNGAAALPGFGDLVPQVEFPSAELLQV